MNCIYPTTVVYDDYWRFAAERQATYERRLVDNVGPWTNDPVIAAHRFTNPYRAADRVSQYLIRDVQYARGRSQEPEEVFFRTMLFKIFNKIETWEYLERQLGPITYRKLRADNYVRLIETLDSAFAGEKAIYSAAYIMPSPPMGHQRKHQNHIALLAAIMRKGDWERFQNSASLKEAFDIMSSYVGIGPFLAFQYVIDLNYSTMMNHDEGEFVVAGPGAIDGIAKCFEGKQNAEEVIMHMVDIQDREFARLGLTFNGLNGRKLQPIDCQNLFCEISKYARVKHPAVVGANGRTKIKQTYKKHHEPMPKPFFPPKWGINVFGNGFSHG